MVDEGIAAATRVRDIFDDAVARGFRAESVRGASDEEIDTWAAAQGVQMVPAALREILRIMGKQGKGFPGGWLSSSAFGVTSIDTTDTEFAVECVKDADESGIEHGMRDPEGMLVVAGDGTGASYVVIDGSDLAEPDPPLWQLDESPEVRRGFESTTAWFASLGEDLMNRRRAFERRKASWHPSNQRHYDALYRW